MIELARDRQRVSERNLMYVRLIHSAAWLLFASAILALPVTVWLGRLSWALGLSGLVMVEVFVLVANGMRCPLTAIAARYTADRSPNFDIYLPVWLARHNKTIFGSLFVAGEFFLLYRLLAAP
ncbi:MAG TPA: hypothetical protein VF603_10905 [Allosphingosinicella sp.]